MPYHVRSSHHPPPGPAKAPDFASQLRLAVSPASLCSACFHCKKILGCWLQNFILLCCFQPLLQSYRWSWFIRICIMELFDLACAVDEAVCIIPSVIWVMAFPFSLILKHMVSDSAGDDAGHGVFRFSIDLSRRWWCDGRGTSFFSKVDAV